MGFFSPTAWNQQKTPLALEPECGRCRLFEKCQSPKMEVTGQGKLKTLIVGEGPGEYEDQQGRQFVGNAGGELMGILHELGINMRQDCWLFNAISCRAATPQGKNRPPANEEVDWCRPRVITLIKKLNPERIILLGKHATHSVCKYAWNNEDNREYTGDGIMAQWASWCIPSVRLNAWLCPTYHPSWVLRNQDRNRFSRQQLKNDLSAAFALSGRPHKTVPDYKRRVQLLYTADEAARVIRKLTAVGHPVAFDFETDRLKPDSQDSKILCCSLSDGDAAWAFPWGERVALAMKDFLLSTTPKIAANMKFEHRWVWQQLDGITVRNWQWDTMLGAHWLTCQGGVTGLKFQAFVRLGVEDYASHLDLLMRGKDSNTSNQLNEAEPKHLLLYCGFDSLYEVLVAREQQKGLV